MQSQVASDRLLGRFSSFRALSIFVFLDCTLPFIIGRFDEHFIVGRDTYVSRVTCDGAVYV